MLKPRLDSLHIVALLLADSECVAGKLEWNEISLLVCLISMLISIGPSEYDDFYCPFHVPFRFGIP